MDTLLLAAILVTNLLFIGSMLFVSWSIRREINAQISAVQAQIYHELEALSKGEPSALTAAAAALGQQVAQGAMSQLQKGSRAAARHKPGLMDFAAMFIPQLRGIPTKPDDGQGGENPQTFKEVF
jgi:hypothetical protein